MKDSVLEGLITKIKAESLKTKSYVDANGNQQFKKTAQYKMLEYELIDNASAIELFHVLVEHEWLGMDRASMYYKIFKEGPAYENYLCALGARYGKFNFPQNFVTATELSKIVKLTDANATLHDKAVYLKTVSRKNNIDRIIDAKLDKYYKYLAKLAYFPNSKREEFKEIILSSRYDKHIYELVNLKVLDANTAFNFMLNNYHSTDSVDKQVTSKSTILDYMIKLCVEHNYGNYNTFDFIIKNGNPLQIQKISKISGCNKQKCLDTLLDKCEASYEEYVSWPSKKFKTKYKDTLTIAQSVVIENGLPVTRYNDVAKSVNMLSEVIVCENERNQ